MGLLVFNLNRLPPPFEYVNESVFEIPATRPLRITNRLVRIILVLDGEAQLQMGDQAPVPLRAGDALVFPRASHYSYLPALPGRGARLHALAISLKNDERASSLNRLVKAQFPDCRHLPTIQNAAMLHYIHLLRSEAESGRKDAGFAVGALATLLITLLFRRKENPPDPPARAPRSSRYLVEQAREFISKNYNEPLSLEQIAWHLRLSAEYLARLFKRETGQTVFECVREIRLNVAKRFLSGTNHPVIRISEMTGFSSPSVFCRVFRGAFGQSPTSYRSQSGGNPLETRAQLGR